MTDSRPPRSDLPSGRDQTGPRRSPTRIREPGLTLTTRHRRLVGRHLDELQAAGTWHGGLPVLLLDRCWLRLTAVAVDQLLERLPPDGSRDAPELVRWRELTASGLTATAVQEQCWQEFGAPAFQAALRRFWEAQERGNHGWTHDSYLALLREYRRRFSGAGRRSLPLLVLARPTDSGANEPHRLHWLQPPQEGGEGTMRHTCP